MNPLQLRTYVIAPVLTHLGLYSQEAENLLVGTACAESLCGKYLHQQNGPALGLYQMEPATAKDIMDNFLKYKPDLCKKVKDLMIPSITLEENLIGNLYFATAMCRVHYLRDKEPIPTTKEGMANMWKRVYNTPLGKGTVEGFLRKWTELE